MVSSTLYYDKAKQQYYLYAEGLFCGDLIPLLDHETLSWNDPEVDQYLKANHKSGILESDLGLIRFQKVKMRQPSQQTNKNLVAMIALLQKQKHLMK